MKLHFDQILKADPSRQSFIDACLTGRKLNPRAGLDIMCFGLEKTGMFPAGAVTTALMALHTENGQQTFVLGEHMTSMLEHTSIAEVSRAELRVPYSTFYIALTKCPHRLWGGIRTQWHNVSGLYVNMDEVTHVLTVMAWAEENERSIADGDDAHVWARLQLDSCDADLEVSVLKLMTNIGNDRSDPIIDPLAIIDGRHGDDYPEEAKEAQVRTMRAMFRIAVNLSLYLASQGPDVERVVDEQASRLRNKIAAAKSPGKRKKLERQLTQRSKATFIKVGKTIETQAQTQVSRHGSVSAHWVRGHWHHYWTGKSRTVKTRKWILPYPKGLDPAEQRIYQVSPAEQP
jgi:hypothetical protein